jgi:hypothetical protein
VNKEIKISATMDLKEFDRQVQSIERNLQKINKPMETVDKYRDGQRKMEQEGQKFDRQAEQKYRQQTVATRRELDEFIRKSSSSVQELDRVIEKQTSKMEELRRKKQEINKEDERSLQINKEIADLQQKMVQSETSRSAQYAGIAKARGMMGGEQPSAGPSLMERLGGGMTKGLAGLGALMAGVERFARPNIIDRNQTLWNAQGSAAMGASDQAQDIYGGNLQKSMFFGQERSQAITEAMKQMKATEALDTAKGAGYSAMIGGGLGTAAAGGVVSPMGVAGLGIAGYGAYNKFMNPRQYSMSFDKERYQATLGQEFAENYQQNYQGLQQRDPLGRLAIDRYMGTSEGNLAAQRRLGLGDKGFYFGEGSLLGGANAAGFREQDILGASQGILGAGGSTKAARSMGVSALRLGRDMDLTNASSMLGGLGGAMGAGEGEQSLVRILSEATRLGLDSSEMSEEQRNFAQAVTNIAIGAQAGSSGAVGDLASMAGNYFDPNSMHGINAGAGLFQLQQQLGSQTSGVRGAIQASAIEGSSFMKHMDDPMRALFAKMTPGSISADNDTVKTMAEDVFGKTGGRVGDKTYEVFNEEFVRDFAREGRRVKDQTTYLSKEADSLRGQITSKYKERFGEGQVTPEEEKGFFESDEIRRLETKLMAQASFGDDAYSGLIDRPKDFRQKLRGDVKSSLGREAGGGAGSVDELLASRNQEFGGFPFRRGEDRSRIADLTISGQAKQEGVVRGEFERNYERIETSARQTAEMSEELMRATLEFTTSLKDSNGKVTKAVSEFAQAVVEATGKLNNQGTSPVGSWMMGIGEQEEKVE